MTEGTTSAHPNGHTPPELTRAGEFDRLAALETDECVIWPYARDKRGYGKLIFQGVVQRTHRLALLRRSSPPPGRNLACHQPGIGCHRACFNYRHLRWASYAENTADMTIDGTDPRGERHGSHKLTEADVREIRQLIATTGMAHGAIARRYGVSQSSISDAAAGRTWGWLE